MLNPAEEADDSEQQGVRTNNRERHLTEKGKEMQEYEAKKNEKAFNKAYDTWKKAAKEIRTKLKTFCSPEELNNASHDIRDKHAVVQQHYEPIRRSQSMTVLTTDICEVIAKRQKNIDQLFNDRLEKERVRVMLNKRHYGSVFGDTKTETSFPEGSVARSKADSTISREVEAEAELAAKVEQAKATQEILAQETKISQMENEWKIKEVETKAMLEEEKTKLQQLKADSEVKVAAARVRALSAQNDIESHDQVSCYNLENSANLPNSAPQLSLNPRALIFRPHNTTPEREELSLVQALASSLTLNRLPVPEPTIFSGDPLKFMDWKVSFMALIGGKPLPVCEKMLYLKSYLAGEARKAVEGYFFRNKERYGSPFVIQRAFRAKLTKWPKIAANDPIALREFADFLQSCAEAIPQVKGLDILNDCEENHKLLRKLPEWIVQRWSRIVVEELDKSQDYPNFARFTKFIQNEAKVVCNPVASPFLMSERASEERHVKRAKALSTTIQPKSPPIPVSTSRPKPPCLFCKEESHGIAKCPAFAAKTSDDKKVFIQENHLCFGCLRRGHVTKECRGRHSCSKCGRRNPICLHTERVNEPKERKTEDSKSPDEGANKEVHNVMTHVLTRKTSSTSSIVPVFVSVASEPEKEILTYALLDTQSDSSFILEDLASELNVDAQPVQLKLSTMTSVDTVVASKLANKLQVRGFDSETRVRIEQAYSRDFIPVDKSHIPTKETALQWPHLEGLADKLQPLQNCEVGLLIGYDCPSALAPLEIVTGKINEPFAQRTLLGWNREGNQSYVHRITVKEMPIPSATDVLKVLETDFNERNYDDKYVSQDDVRFIQILSDAIKQRPDGHYEMPLPFKGNDPPTLPNNKKLATVRLQHLKKRLKADKQYHEHYCSFMRDIISCGDAELAPPLSDGETAWYIPHHGVYHPKKPGKLRVVFDCSAKFLVVSLNDTLLTGPDMINSLVGVLCRFIKENVAIIYDIERMFHQFSVCPDMRNYLRFLWWQDGQLDTEPREYRMAVHLFGASSSPGCANFGLKYLGYSFQQTLTSVPSVKEAQELITETQALCRLGGLHLHKFNSNQSDALSQLEPSDRADTTKPLDLKPDTTAEGHVLGIQWSIKNDTFSFKINTKDQPPTCRSILSVISSLYDPLGFVAPFTLRAKSILQELCRRGTEWDDPLLDNLRSRWEDWKDGLERLKSVAPPELTDIVKVELHHFCDASDLGYGACSYIRYLSNEKVHCSLVMAKARVAPTKVTSIPRLELSAALQMWINEEFFWTDSQVVLAYINNEARRFHVFVANRVQLIRQTTDPKQWHYIDTAQNPADYTSRGLSASEIMSTCWLSGPKFLWEHDISYAPSPSAVLLVGDPEVKAVKALTTETSEQDNILSRLSTFSSWSMLLKVVARIKRLRSSKAQYGNFVTVDKRKTAADTTIKLLQQQAFSQEMEVLKVGDNPPSSSPLFRVDPVLDQGLLRVGGRLKKSTLCQGLKHPIILPKDHHKVDHCSFSCADLLNGFWVIGGSKGVAKLISKCVQCRKLRRSPEEQRMSELPKERVEISDPFMYCGMDCFGLFVTKQGRKEHKRYGLLFTCLSSHAVHIEMLEGLSTDSFINTLRCFISLRGAVCKLYSDQGTNFIGAKNELRESLKQCDTDALEAFLANKQCEFVFNAASASHAGGVWEGQIRTIRSVLNATIAQCQGRLDDSSLRTLFYEAMFIVNGRPLSVDGINDPKSSEPLTPNHLILMKSKVALPPPGKFMKEDLYARKRWRRVQYLTEQFWSRWKREYLLNISTRQKWHVPQDMLPRNQWQLARVVEAPEEDDGLVRRVKLQVGDRSLTKKQGTAHKPHIVERPVQKLVVLLENN
ncbi:hypothetical protein ACER0C_005859 [Sarotherodon galilaeus]